MNETNKYENTKTLLSKQKKLIIVLAAIVFVLALAAFVVLPLVFRGQLHEVEKKSKYGDEIETYIYDNELSKNITGDLLAMLEGSKRNEYNVRKSNKKNIRFTFNKDNVTITSYPYIFPQVEVDDIAKISVSNPKDTFNVYSYECNFYIEGAEKNLYNANLLSSLILNARYMLSNGYVEQAEDLYQYGLAENWRAMVTVFDKSGKENTVYIGNSTSDGTYYMKHKDKDMVYLMDNGASAFFYGIDDYLSPVVVKAIDVNERNYLDTFTLKKNGQDFFSCAKLTDEQRTGAYINQLHRMTYPTPEHVLNTTTLYNMFELCAGLSGQSVLAYGVSSQPDVLSHLGFDAPIAEISYTYGGESYGFSVGNMTDDGTYCVYSPYQDTIVKVPAESLSFLNYEVIDLYQTNIFQYRIDLVSEVEIKHGKQAYKFALSGEGKDLTVTEALSAKAIDTASFRQLYISLLGVTIGGYSSLDGEGAAQASHELTFGVTLKTGEKLIYDFYSESPVSLYMVVDGKGGFRTDKLAIDAIKEKTGKLMSGQVIESEF